MRLEVGKVYVTRDGKNKGFVFGESFSMPGKLTVEMASGSVYRYGPDGCFDILDGRKVDSDFDLVREFREPVVHERWVVGFLNANLSFSCSVFHTQSEAEEWGSRHHCSPLGIQRVTFTEQPE